MGAPRVFVSHSSPGETQREYKLLQQFIADLRSAGIDVVAYTHNRVTAEFVQFLSQELPTCQWLILFQTPGALSAPDVQMAVNTTLTLTEQGHMQGVLRFIVTPSETQVLPRAWQSIATFDATYDYARALEKLLLTLSVRKPAQETLPVAPPPEPRVNPVLAPTYDRPAVALSRWQAFKAKLQQRDAGNLQISIGRRTLLTVLVILVIATILVSGTAVFLTHRPTANKPSPTPQPVVANTSVGSVYFLDSGIVGTANTTGFCDGIQIDLSHLSPPTAGDSYYAWLLPDLSKSESSALLIAKLTLTNGAVQHTYMDPAHQNLLARYSRFLITDENANVTPIDPTPNTQQWSYYAAISETPNPTDMDHYSELDHLRHLLSGEPTLNSLSLTGGLIPWFYQNVGSVFAGANAARGTEQPQDPAMMHTQFVRILDYLDGSAYVKQDVPRKTPLMVNATVAKVSLLTMNSNQNPASYMSDFAMHLQGFASSPNTTTQQRTLDSQINAAVNQINVNLKQARKDAQQLVRMNNKQLLNSSTIPLLDDLLKQTYQAYVGVVDPTTGTLNGGATWVYDHIQQLATLTVTKYAAGKA